jgi:hypothetical protein
LRITSSEAKVIKETASVFLGRGRTMPKKGGDIDLYIEPPPEDYDYAKKVRFWCDLVKYLGDQKTKR